MSDSKKYYYLKVKDDFFESDANILLESMPDGYLYSNILMKLYLRSLKDDGKLSYNDKIPYTPVILSKLTRHPVGVIEKALNVFLDLELIETLENGVMYMTEIETLIGKSSTEADRKRLYRQRIEKDKLLLSAKNGQMSGQMSDKRPLENRVLEPEKEIRVKRLKKEEETHPLQIFISDNLPNVSKLKTQMTYKNCVGIIAKYKDIDRIKYTLESMENHKSTANKTYQSVNLTLQKWLRLEEERNNKPSSSQIIPVASTYGTYEEEKAENINNKKTKVYG